VEMSKRAPEDQGDKSLTDWDTIIKSPLSVLLKGKGDLIVVRHTTTLKHVMDILKTENILSLPVIDEDDSFLGFIDVLDIAGFALATWRNLSVNLDRLHFPANSLFRTEIKDVLNFSSVNYPVLIGNDKVIADVIDLFKRPKTYFRLHRIGVIDERKKLINVISQSDIISFAAKHISHLETADRPLSSFSGLIRTPIMIQIDSLFSEALETLFKNRISGLALVDQEFRLSGNLSASDLRGMNSLGFDFFNGSCLQFLVKGTKSSMKSTQAVNSETTLGEVVQILAEEKIHRIYITSFTGFPTGSVSLIDAIVRLH